MNGPSIDFKTGGQLNIDVMHSKIHEGRAYTISNRYSTIANGAYATMLIKNGSSDELHMVFSGASTGNAIAFLLGGVTAATNGTSLVAYNKDASKGTYSGASFWAGGTVTNTGIAQFISFLAGGEGPKSVGSEISEANEWILPTNQTFLAAIQNTSGATKEIYINATFYIYSVI